MFSLRRFSGSSIACFTVLGLVLVFLGSGSTQAQAAECARTITARAVALDQPIMFNRLGAQLWEFVKNVRFSRTTYILYIGRGEKSGALPSVTLY